MVKVLGELKYVQSTANFLSILRVFCNYTYYKFHMRMRSEREALRKLNKLTLTCENGALKP